MPERAITVKSIDQAIAHLLDHESQGVFDYNDPANAYNSLAWVLGLATGIISSEEAESAFNPVEETLLLLTYIKEKLIEHS